MRTIIFGKFAGLLLVAVLLLLGLDQITSLVHERQGRHQSAVDSVASSLAGSQTLLGPLLHTRCTEEWNESGDKGAAHQRRDFTLTALPSTVTLSGTSNSNADTSSNPPSLPKIIVFMSPLFVRGRELNEPVRRSSRCEPGTALAMAVHGTPHTEMRAATWHSKWPARST